MASKKSGNPDAAAATDRREKSMTEFPCYDCDNIGEEVPRCTKWKRCKAYRAWIRSQGMKGLLIYAAGLIVERREASLLKGETKNEH
jgi:hypothetical protein